MANEYCTLAELNAHRMITTLNGIDDAVIGDILDRASRMIDGICGRWFYAYTTTRYLSFPYRNTTRALDLGEDCLTITTLTNGDGSVIAGSEYFLDPRNHPVKTRVILKQGSIVVWQPDASGNTENVIEAAGTWGYCDRAATDPYSATVISATKGAAILIANQMYQERSGANLNGSVQVTGAGVVITPQGAIPKAAYDMIRPYIKPVFATSDDLVGHGW